MRTELLKTHVKPDNSGKTLSHVVAETRAIESAMQANKIIADSSKGNEEEVHWTNLRHSQMKLRREPGTCFWCGDRKGPHTRPFRSSLLGSSKASSTKLKQQPETTSKGKTPNKVQQQAQSAEQRVYPTKRHPLH